MWNFFNSTSVFIPQANLCEWEMEEHMFQHLDEGCEQDLTSQEVGSSGQRHPETGGKR